MTKLLLSSVGLLIALAAAPAVAADMPVKSPPLYVPAWSWSGFYIGINGGYSIGRDNIQQTLLFTSPPPPVVFGQPSDMVVSPVGGVFGAQIGWNWQVGTNVFGVEADAQWTRQSHTVCGLLCESGGGPGQGVIANTVTHEVKWLATARGRLGFAQDSYLLYVTGGAAWARVNETDMLEVDPFFVAGSSSSHTRVGWTAGVGIEVRLWGNLTGKLEYLYVDLGRMNTNLTLAFPTGMESIGIVSDLRDNIIRAGLSYKFGWH
jgi:outer membrane immunogenic protein